MMSIDKPRQDTRAKSVEPPAPVEREASEADDPAGSRRWLRLLAPAALVVLVILAAVSIQHLAREVTYADVADALDATPWSDVALAILLTGGSFFALSFYDVAALDHAGHKLPYPIVALTSFCAYAVGNTAGFGPLSGGAVRYRFYTPFGLEPDAVGRVVAFVTLAFGLGLAATTAAGFLLAAATVAVPVGLSPAAVRLAGAAILVALALLFVLSLRRGGALRLGPWRLRAPRPRLVGQQLAVTMLDICASAAVLWVLLPQNALGFPAFVAIYAVAVGLGVLSHVPAGLGIFETVIIAGLGHAVPVDAVLGALVLYRLVYHGLPLAVAAVIIGFIEARRASLGAAASRTLRAGGKLAPLVLSAVTFLVGGLLVVSGVTPIPSARIDVLSAIMPLPILEGAHFLSSVIGVGLLIAARSLAFRLDGAWWFAVIALAAALLLAPLKALAFGEATILASLLLVLIVSRRIFSRPASLLHQPLTPGWLAAVGTIVIGAVALLLFAYKDVVYTHELWWQFEVSAEAPRSLRALVGIALAASAVACWSLLRPTSGRTLPPSEEELARAVAIVEAQPQPDGNLVRMGDKSLIFSQDGRAFIMFAKQGRSWIALADPIGPGDAWPGLVWHFVETARQHGGRAVFYQVAADHLGLYADAGLMAFKLGEDARMKLASFELTGSKRAPLRNALSKGERAGLSFELLPATLVGSVVDELQAISDGWLAEHQAREKRFSLGAFDRRFVCAQPVALVREAGRIVAFATVMVTGLREEATIDLMRFTPDAPNGTMDYLFLKLIDHFKRDGYGWFNLGMAPLSGFSDSPAAPIWNRIGRAAFEHGERFYNFRGLRSFKAKFQPQWRGRYMVVSGGMNPLFALADATVLIGGGLRGVVGK